MKNYLAAINVGDIRGLGPLGLEGEAGSNAPTRFNLYISSAIGLITTIALIWFTFTFLIGAIGIIVADGDKGKLESARSRITNGILGVAVTIAGIFIIQFIGSILGVGDIILSPTDIIERISPTAPQNIFTP